MAFGVPVSLPTGRHSNCLNDKMAKRDRTFASGTVAEFPEASAAVKQWQDLLGRRSS